MEPIGIADSLHHLVVNPSPRFHLVVGPGSYGELAASFMGVNCKFRRPGKEAQRERRNLHVGFGRKSEVNTQRLRNGAQDRWPLLGGIPSRKRVTACRAHACCWPRRLSSAKKPLARNRTSKVDATENPA